MANFDRVGLLALVSEYGGPRHNFQVRQSRKTVDDVFGNPIAQIIQIRIAAGINQRHDSDRMNSIVFGPLVSKEEIESYVDEHQNRYPESECRIVGLPYNQGRWFDRRLLWVSKVTGDISGCRSRSFAGTSLIESWQAYRIHLGNKHVSAPWHGLDAPLCFVTERPAHFDQALHQRIISYE